MLSSSFKEHVALVTKVLNTLQSNGIKINMKKGSFFADKVSFLGHDISLEGIQKSAEYIEKVKNYPKPTNVTELRQFLGLCNFSEKVYQPILIDSQTVVQPHRWSEERKDSLERRDGNSF